MVTLPWQIVMKTIPIVNGACVASLQVWTNLFVVTLAMIIGLLNLRNTDLDCCTYICPLCVPSLNSQYIQWPFPVPTPE